MSLSTSYVQNFKLINYLEKLSPTTFRRVIKVRIISRTYSVGHSKNHLCFPSFLSHCTEHQVVNKQHQQLNRILQAHFLIQEL